MRYNKNIKGIDHEMFEDIFLKGYGKIKVYNASFFGLDWTYYNHPTMTQKEIKSSPTYVIEPDQELVDKAERMKKEYLVNKPKDISVKQFAIKIKKKYDCILDYSSPSGSIYLVLNEKRIRISDHFVINFHPEIMSDFDNYDFEIVQKSFNEKTSIDLKEYIDEEDYKELGLK